MRTDDLIQRLAADLPPVTRLARPATRGLGWVGVTGAALFAVVGIRALATGMPLAGIAAALATSQGATVATSLAAAIAAYTSLVPGASRRALAWTAATGTLWLASLVNGASREDPTALARSFGCGTEWTCVAMIAVGALAAVAVFTRTAQRGAAVSPRLTVALAAWSAAGLASVVSCLAHPHASHTVLLGWHGATVGMAALAGAAAGPWLVRWPAPLPWRDGHV